MRAIIRDISAYERDTVELELSFDPDDQNSLAFRHKNRIAIEFEGEKWMATIGLKNRRPYVWKYLYSNNNKKISQTSLLHRHGCEHGDGAEFEMVVPRKLLRFLHCVPGAGPPPRPGPKQKS